jgi:hypothetical protein
VWFFSTAALGCEKNRELIPECFLFAESMQWIFLQINGCESFYLRWTRVIIFVGQPSGEFLCKNFP